MKSLLGKLGVILIGLMISEYAEVWGADWKLYNSNDKFLSYYDAQSITRPSENIARVWVRRDYTEKGVSDWVENVGKKYENLNHAIILREINCAEKKSHRLSSTMYDDKGGVIISLNSPTGWAFIIPESSGEALYRPANRKEANPINPKQSKRGR